MSQTSKAENSEEINISEIIRPYLNKWKWFLLSLFLLISLVLFYILRTSPVYEIRSTVLIRDVKKSALDFGMMSELSSFGGRSSSTINNEMELLRSRKLMKEVVERLGIRTKVFAENGLKKPELYGEMMPFAVKVITEKEIDPDVKIRPVKVKMSGDILTLDASGAVLSNTNTPDFTTAFVLLN